MNNVSRHDLFITSVWTQKLTGFENINKNLLKKIFNTESPVYSDPNVYGPYPKGGRHISIVKEIECSPCYKNFKLPNCATLDCLNGIDVKDVYQAVAKHIRSSRIGVKT